jgi:hypothetical protein
MFLEMSLIYKGGKVERVPPFTADNKAKCRISLPLIQPTVPAYVLVVFLVINFNEYQAIARAKKMSENASLFQLTVPSYGSGE